MYHSWLLVGFSSRGASSYLRDNDAAKDECSQLRLTTEGFPMFALLLFSALNAQAIGQRSIIMS